MRNEECLMGRDADIPSRCLEREIYNSLVNSVRSFVNPPKSHSVG